MDGSSPATGIPAKLDESTASDFRTAGRMSTLESFRRDGRLTYASVMASQPHSIRNKDDLHPAMTSASSFSRERDAVTDIEDDGSIHDESDDDLDVDLAKAALHTGTEAFEAHQWVDADALFQEALGIIDRLPKRQRASFDIFDLQYKLAVCVFHTQGPSNAEAALTSFIQQPTSSDEERAFMYSAVHLLSCLYIRVGQIDRARSACEKAWQARKRMSGKQSDASLESTALMAHIYGLLNNPARNKACLGLIPEARRVAILKSLEEALGTKVEHLVPSSPLASSVSEDSRSEAEGFDDDRTTVSMENRCYGPVSSMIHQPRRTSLQQGYQHVPSIQSALDERQSASSTSFLATGEGDRTVPRESGRSQDHYSVDPEVLSVAALSLNDSTRAVEIAASSTLSRKEILDRVKCQPRDDIEAAVCAGDQAAFVKVLNKKTGFWQSKLRKRVRPERVTALHFAALFGEIEMARRLIGSGYDINEVPYGYTTVHTPLKFAVGARQVEMVRFLVANGARPSGLDSWATLAAQLMNRSWLLKTTSEALKEDLQYVPNQIVAIMHILRRHGWDTNVPFEASGKTVLHQAVNFWSGSYRWDLELRNVVTSFLCEQGADPFKADSTGQTPFDLASLSGHRDLLLILNRGLDQKGAYNGSSPPIELYNGPPSPVELFVPDHSLDVDLLKSPYYRSSEGQDANRENAISSEKYGSTQSDKRKRHRRLHKRPP